MSSNSLRDGEHPLDRMPLRVRLVLILSVLLVVALAVTALTTLSLLKRSLISQVDENLDSAVQVLEARGAWPANTPTSRQPNTYYMRVMAADGSTYLNVPATTGTDAVPDIPPISYDETLQLAGTVRTVDSVEGPTQWRMVLVRGVQEQTGAPVSVAIALPLNSVNATLHQMQLFILLVGLGVVLLAGITGYAAVHRSLRGLRAIEDTAAAVVASGDLTRRAPVAPDSTEVGRLGASFNAMVANLETAFAAQAASEARMRRFVSDASHELRTPLASIRGYGELYRMGAVPAEELPSTFSRIESEAIRMGTLVNDLLALARLDERQGLRLTEVDLREIASDALGDLHALDPDRPTELVGDTAVPVIADADRIRQVVTNLIGNVVQHTPAGTAVEIAVAAESGWARLEVRDHGPGVPPEAASRIFERFYRPDSSRARTSGGAGLGLAIVATILAAHHGTVEYRPTPGGGTTIVVHLPQAQPGTTTAPDS